MEGIHSLRDLLLPGDWLAKIDLKDAYLTVPIHPSCCPCLQFTREDQKWEFSSLPFGLSSAPWCFTKLMRPVMAVLRSRGVRLIIYLDDILIMARTRDQILLHVHWAVSLLEELGFLLNEKKSILIPARAMEFLGFLVDTRSATLSLPHKKLTDLQGNKDLAKERTGVLACGCSDCRSVVGINSGDISGTATLQGITTPQDQTSLGGFVLFRSSSFVSGGLGQTPMVAPKCPGLEWKDNFQFQTRPDYRIECQPERLGSPVRIFLHGREVVRGRVTITHKLPRTSSRVVCTQKLRFPQVRLLCTDPHGQYHGGTVYQSSGRHKVESPGGHRQGIMAVLPAKECSVASRVSAGHIQLRGGLEFQVPDRTQRLEVASFSFSSHSLPVGTAGVGSLCVPAQSPTTTVLQLAA
ncbi:uncharacterized protein LOC130267762 [Hyla sarda]|uniref:uncharacterized protein LOC130267762 n=1 Tax=Hyla sarda TaxID=327740 RepID=UPI0024C46729|nr:uncharacterized protein LOC130267762 [Hyla sarda]